MAGLDSYLKQLGEGLDTRIGEAGANISGGQRQRIALARLFYRRRSFVVMDEATNELDKETEQKVFENILNNREHSCVILVSHDSGLRKHCNKFINLT